MEEEIVIEDVSNLLILNALKCIPSDSTVAVNYQPLMECVQIVTDTVKCLSKNLSEDFRPIFQNSYWRVRNSEADFKEYVTKHCFNIRLGHDYMNFIAVCTFVVELLYFSVEHRYCYRFIGTASNCLITIFNEKFRATFDDIGGWTGFKTFCRKCNVAINLLEIITNVLSVQNDDSQACSVSQCDLEGRINLIKGEKNAEVKDGSETNRIGMNCESLPDSKQELLEVPPSTKCDHTQGANFIPQRIDYFPESDSFKVNSKEQKEAIKEIPDFTSEVNCDDETIIRTERIENVPVSNFSVSERTFPESDPVGERTFPESDPVGERTFPESDPVGERTLLESDPVGERTLLESDPVGERTFPESGPVEKITFPDRDAVYGKEFLYCNAISENIVPDRDAVIASEVMPDDLKLISEEDLVYSKPFFENNLYYSTATPENVIGISEINLENDSDSTEVVCISDDTDWTQMDCNNNDFPIWIGIDNNSDDLDWREIISDSDSEWWEIASDKDSNHSVTEAEDSVDSIQAISKEIANSMQTITEGAAGSLGTLGERDTDNLKKTTADDPDNPKSIIKELSSCITVEDDPDTPKITVKDYSDSPMTTIEDYLSIPKTTVDYSESLKTTIKDYLSIPKTTVEDDQGISKITVVDNSDSLNSIVEDNSCSPKTRIKDDLGISKTTVGGNPGGMQVTHDPDISKIDVEDNTDNPKSTIEDNSSSSKTILKDYPDTSKSTVAGIPCGMQTSPDGGKNILNTEPEGPICDHKESFFDSEQERSTAISVRHILVSKNERKSFKSESVLLKILSESNPRSSIKIPESGLENSTAVWKSEQLSSEIISRLENLKNASESVVNRFKDFCLKSTDSQQENSDSVTKYLSSNSDDLKNAINVASNYLLLRLSIDLTALKYSKYEAMYKKALNVGEGSVRYLKIRKINALTMDLLQHFRLNINEETKHFNMRFLVCNWCERNCLNIVKICMNLYETKYSKPNLVKLDLD